MTKSELIEKLEDIEWEDFEVKEAKSEIPKSSWETVSAFSNTAGGWMIFGVSKKRIEVKSKKYNFKDKAVLDKYNKQLKTLKKFEEDILFLRDNFKILSYSEIFDYIKKMQVDGYLAGNFWAILAFFLDAVFR